MDFSRSHDNLLELVGSVSDLHQKKFFHKDPNPDPYDFPDWDNLLGIVALIKNQFIFKSILDGTFICRVE